MPFVQSVSNTQTAYATCPLFRQTDYTRTSLLPLCFRCRFPALAPFLLSLCCLISRRLKDRALASMGEEDEGKRDGGIAREVEVERYGEGRNMRATLASR